jgi:hypothetical protein
MLLLLGSIEIYKIEVLKNIKWWKGAQGMSAPLHFINWIFQPKYSMAQYSTIVLLWGAHIWGTFSPFFLLSILLPVFRFLCLVQPHIRELAGSVKMDKINFQLLSKTADGLMYKSV